MSFVQFLIIIIGRITKINEELRIWPGDWSQFLSELLATGVGIFAPIFLQTKIEKRAEMKKACQMLIEIQLELDNIVTQLKNIKKEVLYINPVKTPIWDSINNTNDVRLLSLFNSKNRKKINSDNLENLTKCIFQTYDLVEEYNQWLNVYTQGAIVGSRQKEDLVPIIDSIEIVKQQLLCESENNLDYHLSISFTKKEIDETLYIYKRHLRNKLN